MTGLVRTSGRRRLSLLARLCMIVAILTSGWHPHVVVQGNTLKRLFSARHQNQVLKEVDVERSLDDLYYEAFSALPSGERPRAGEPTESSSCDVIRPVPAALRLRYVMRPFGIVEEFYDKFTEAYGIPVVAATEVPNRALSRACYVLRFLLSDRADLRRAYYKSYGRVAVIGRQQTLSDVPEYRALGVDSVPFPPDDPTGLPVRSLGAVAAAPVTTVPEENILCYNEQPRHPDDVLLKSLAIGILNLAAASLSSRIREELDNIYSHAMASGWWTSTNAARGPESYFGEGVQSFFSANAYASPADGFHNMINTRVKLRSYDTRLYGFVQTMFPCANHYIKRCNTRGNEAYQTLEMDCPLSGWYDNRRRRRPIAVT